jgi:hypothetical protein
MSYLDCKLARCQQVDRAIVEELHYIAPMANLASIFERGILSHNRAERVEHESVADEAIQDRRADKKVPGGRFLHDYVNTYFDARNPMMSRRRNLYRELVVIRIDEAVLDLPDVVITDGNAASSGTLFAPSPRGLRMLEEEDVYAERWTDPDPWTYWEKKRLRCAEVLIPDRLPPEFLQGCYVCLDAGAARCDELVPGCEIEVNRHVFLR